MPIRYRMFAAALATTLAASLPAAAAPQAKKPAAAATSATSGIPRARMEAAAKRAFVEGDTNKDGFVDRKEFAARLTALLNRTPPGSKGAPSAAQAKQLIALAQASFNAADLNKDGKLSPIEAQKQQLAIFDRMDTNHDGMLSPAERLAGAKARATEMGR